MKRFIALTALIAATALPVLAQQDPAATMVWSTVAGSYTTSNGNTVNVSVSGSRNQHITIQVGSNRQAGEYVDIPLIFHLYGNTISTWDTFAIRWTYENSKIDVAAFSEPTTGNFSLYWFSTFAGTGAQGTFTNLRIRTGVASPLLGGGAGQIYQDPAPGITDFAISVSNTAQVDNQFAPDYGQPGSEAAQKGVLSTRNGVNNAANRQPFLLRVFIGTEDFSYSPTLRDQSLLTEFNQRVPMDFDARISVVPEPASMIALGSGLVGLLALRRRRAN